MMKLFSLLLLWILAFASCAQSKVAVRDSYAFLRQNSRGTIAVDDKGEPVNHGPDSQYIAYVEIPAAIEPVWSTAWINRESYDVFGTKVSSPVTPGTRLNSDMPVRLTAKAGNSLWELSFQKGAKQAMPAKYKSSAGDDIVIKAVYNKKEIFVAINNITQLNPLIYP